MITAINCSIASELDINRNVILAPLEMREIADNREAGLAYDHGEYQIELTSLAPILLDKKVNRRVDKLWSLLLPYEQNIANLKVNYKLIARNGRVGYMSHNLSAMDQVKVDIRALPLNIKSQFDNKIVEGGINMQIHLSDIRRAGDYSGNLYVSVTYL